MDLLLLQYFDNQDTSLLKQYFLTFPLFAEMQHFIGQNLFNTLLSYFQVAKINYSQPVQISTKTMYIFMSAGVLISKKQNKQTMQKYSRMSKKIRFSQMLSRTVVQNINRQSQKFKTVTPQQIMNESLLFSSGASPSSNQYYISNENRISAIIYLPIKSLPQQLLSEVRQKHHQKLKFLMSTDIFRNVQKHHIEQSLKSFQLIKISFDEHLFKHNLRTTKIFIVMNGQIQITTQDKKRKIKKYSTVVLTNHTLSSAKSISQTCIAFTIEKEEVTNILRKNMEGKYRNQETQHFLDQIINCSNQQEQNSQIEPKQQVKSFNINRYSESNIINQSSPQIMHRVERLQRGDTFPIFKNRNSQQNKQKIHRNKTANITQKKKFRIKQHFTNTINQHYKEYSQKKTQLILKKGEISNGILYSMKTRVAKPPNMQQINQKLNQQRKKKIFKCKQNILLTKQVNLSAVNLRIYEQFQQSKIMDKLKNDISQFVRKKQRKHFWKYPNCYAFNKFADHIL